MILPDHPRSVRARTVIEVVYLYGGTPGVRARTVRRYYDPDTGDLLAEHDPGPVADASHIFGCDAPPDHKGPCTIRNIRDGVRVSVDRPQDPPLPGWVTIRDVEVHRWATCVRCAHSAEQHSFDRAQHACALSHCDCPGWESAHGVPSTP